MADMKAYLAEKYMSGPKADAILAKLAPKKKKRKTTITAPVVTQAGGVMLQDEDTDWGDANRQNEDPDDPTEAVVASDRSFKKRKTAGASGSSSWTTIREGTSSTTTKQESPPPPDEQPVVVDQTPFAGGLVSATQLQKAMQPKTKKDEISKEDIEAAQETVYRDASGRRIDTKREKADAARKKREREEKDAQKMEWGKGLVQRDDAEKRRQELERQKTLPFARHADDKQLNEELKSKELWNDPAAAFLSKKKTKGPKRPEYKGPPPPPNRFGIKPGYRWDGVDRGNGFEKKLFQTLNERNRRGKESYEWGTEDM